MSIREQLLSPYEVPSAAWFIRTVGVPARVALVCVLLVDSLERLGVRVGVGTNIIGALVQIGSGITSRVIDFVLRPTAVGSVLDAIGSALRASLTFVNSSVIQFKSSLSSWSWQQVFNSPSLLVFCIFIVSFSILRSLLAHILILKSLPKRMQGMGHAFMLTSDTRLLPMATATSAAGAAATKVMLLYGNLSAQWANVMHITTLVIIILTPLICEYVFEIFAGIVGGGGSGREQETIVMREHERGGVYNGEWSSIGGSGADSDGSETDRNKRSSASQDGRVIMKHGVGIYKYTNGDVYQGEWRFNKKEGRGLYTFQSGAVYAGEWKKGASTLLVQYNFHVSIYHCFY